MRWGRLLQVLLLSAAALCPAGCAGATPAPTPAPTPSLNTNLWVDFPAVRGGQAQAVNVSVSDLQGISVPRADVVIEVETEGYRREYPLPITDQEGRSRVAVEVPMVSVQVTVTVRVVVVDDFGRWDSAETSFRVYP